jgi:tRNA threonylcarbamoyladenosine biosynthesis protein TsaB
VNEELLRGAALHEGAPLEGRLLALDTATSQATLALGEPDGRRVAGRDWQAGHGHTASLLAALEALLAETSTPLRALAGVVAGIGPGSFTGLRVGLATAKVIAYSLRCPIVGVSTPEALALAASVDIPSPLELAVVMPAGPSGAYLTRMRVAGGDGLPQTVEPSRLVEARDRLTELVAGSPIVAVDLADDWVSPGSRERGRAALAGLGRALLVIGSARLKRGSVDDVAELVPAYVTLPRGVPEVAGGVGWSHDPR